MKNIPLTLVFTLGLVASIYSQKVVTWKVIKNVKFKEVFLEEYQGLYDVPKFRKKVSSLNGKEIQIKGYIIPIDEEQEYYILSSGLYCSLTCCGNNHMETMIEVQISGEHRRFEINEIITFEGKLRLNTDDIYQLWYILEDAKVID